MTSTEALPPLTAEQRRPSTVDLAVGVGMLLLGALSVFLVHDLGEASDLGRLVEWADYLAVLLLIGPVPWRRMAPIAICLWVGVGFAVFRLLGVPEGPMSSLAVFMVIHAAGAHVAEARKRDLARGAALAAGFLALAYGIGKEVDAVGFETVLGAALAVGINLGFYVAAYVLGDRDRNRRVIEAELHRRAEQLAEERERSAQQAVTEERIRIARELHDVVAHHVSVMGVQAAGARHIMSTDPARAGEALGHVEASGRQAVSELQRLVGVLREDDAVRDEAVRDDAVRDEAPQPDLAALPSLLSGMATAGLDVELRTIGRPHPMPSSVELSAFRIIQEALTNVVRHAPGARTTVVLSHLRTGLQVEVVNQPAPGRPAGRPGGGRGLLGMQERAAMLGGRIEAGPVSRGGYRVVAFLPVERADGRTGREVATQAEARDEARVGRP